jgi:probable biosynthetic protein (TIGR04098 family)
MQPSRTSWWLGMPHTQAGGMSEAALFAHAGDLRWRDLCGATGVAASEQRDAEGHRVYASFYYVEIGGFPPSGLAAFGPDDRLEVVGTLSRFGRSMLDGVHRLYPADTLPATLPDPLPPAPYVRLSNVFVREARGPDDLRVTTPVTGDLDAIPPSAAEPDSYRMIREARASGRFVADPEGAVPLWEGGHRVVYRIDPDRDINGVGLVYFANYVVFTDVAERRALEEAGGLAPATLDGRRTLRRQVGFYGNAQRHDELLVDVHAVHRPESPRHLLLHHHIRRRTDDRLIAVSSVEKLLPA